MLASPLLTISREILVPSLALEANISQHSRADWRMDTLSCLSLCNHSLYHLFSLLLKFSCFLTAKSCKGYTSSSCAASFGTLDNWQACRSFTPTSLVCGSEDLQQVVAPQSPFSLHPFPFGILCGSAFNAFWSDTTIYIISSVRSKFEFGEKNIWEVSPQAWDAAWFPNQVWFSLATPEAPKNLSLASISPDDSQWVPTFMAYMFVKYKHQTLWRINLKTLWQFSFFLTLAAVFTFYKVLVIQ